MNQRNSTMKPGLIVVDMQIRFKHVAQNMNIVGNIVEVMKACHDRSIPVFITQHHDPDPTTVTYRWWARTPLPKDCDDWKLITDISQATDQRYDTFIDSKVTYDAFYGTELKQSLLEHGVDTVVVCGVVSNLCCETTARSAFVNNFSVVFLSDGNAARAKEFHDATIKNLETGFATIMTCQEFINCVQKLNA